jgi:hypothetical protein
LAFHSGREADHSPPSSAEVKEWVEMYLHSPNTPSWRGDQLGGAQDNLLKKPIYRRERLTAVKSESCFKHNVVT